LLKKQDGGSKMKFSTAKKYLQQDIEKMDLITIQNHKICLLDAWRFADVDACQKFQPNGKLDGVINGFFVRVVCDGVEPVFAPKDIWLAHNLMEKYERCVEIEKQMLMS